MKQLILLLFVSISAFGQTLDTLFYKDFNDQSPSSNLPGGKGNFYFQNNAVTGFTNGGDTNSINGTKSLMYDVQQTRLTSILFFPNQQNLNAIFNVVVPNVDYDSVFVSYQLKGTNLSYNQNSINFLPTTFSGINVSYYNSATSKSFFKMYTARYMSPFMLDPLVAGTRVSFTKINARRSDILVKTGLGATQNYSYSLLISNPVGMVSVPELGNVNMFPESQLKSSILSHFCNTTDNVSACMTSAYINPPIGNFTLDFNRIFMLDNIVVLGKGKKTVTSLEEEIHNTTKNVVKAYNLQGQEIVDIPHYQGIAIEVYSDGTRAKVLK